MKKMKRLASMLLALAMILTSVLATNAGEVKAADTFKGGTYKGTVDKHVDAMQSDIHYDIVLEMANGEYKYKVDISVTGKMNYNTTQNLQGTYTVDGNNITMTGDLKSAVVDPAGNLALSGKLSSFSDGSDTVNLTLDKPVEPEVKPEVPEEKPEVKEDVLTSGDYVLTEESYDASAFMKLPAKITINTEGNRFAIVGKNKENPGWDEKTDKGTGTISFNEKTGVYTMTYETLESKKGQTTTFTATNNSITFTTPMHFGNAKMNVMDSEGNFLPYTAKKAAAEPEVKPEVKEDVLTSGDYVLTEESYDASAMMKMAIKIVIDKENMRFSLFGKNKEKTEWDEKTDKGTGTISFDEKTGVYTMTYETLESKKGQTTTFTATEDSITFTTPLHYGNAKMNILDENGNFIPYTANKVAVEPEVKPEVKPEEKPEEKPEVKPGEDNKKPATKPGKQVVVTKKVAPRTGDDNQMMLMMALFAAAVATTAVTYSRRRTER